MEAGKVLEKLRNPGCLNFSDGCPRDQLFWCAVNSSREKLAIGAYHGKVYLVRISFPHLDKKSQIKLRAVKQEWHEMALHVTNEVLHKSVKIMQKKLL